MKRLLAGLFVAALFTGCATSRIESPGNNASSFSILAPFDVRDLDPFFKEGNAYLEGELCISENLPAPRNMVWLIPETSYTKAVIETWFANIRQFQRDYSNKFPLSEIHVRQLFDNSYATFCARDNSFRFSKIPPGHYYLLTRSNNVVRGENGNVVWWYIKKTELVENEIVKEQLGELQQFNDAGGVFRPVILRRPRAVE